MNIGSKTVCKQQMDVLIIYVSVLNIAYNHITIKHPLPGHWIHRKKQTKNASKWKQNFCRKNIVKIWPFCSTTCKNEFRLKSDLKVIKVQQLFIIQFSQILVRIISKGKTTTCHLPWTKSNLSRYRNWAIE